MTLSLAQLQKPKQKRRRRVGRGNASGRGTYSGRGLKGQRARSGGKSGLKRRGVKQFLLQVPKTRGFKAVRPAFVGVNLGDIVKRFDAGAVVNPKRMHAAGLVHTPKRIKVLGSGSIDKKLTIQAHAFSKAAAAAIEQAGGSPMLIPIIKRAPKKHAEKKQKKQ